MVRGMEGWKEISNGKDGCDGLGFGLSGIFVCPSHCLPLPVCIQDRSGVFV